MYLFHANPVHNFGKEITTNSTKAIKLYGHRLQPCFLCAATMLCMCIVFLLTAR